MKFKMQIFLSTNKKLTIFLFHESGFSIFVDEVQFR